MLPQFKTEVYTSQIFWLLTSFGLLWVALRYLISPQLERIRKSRSQQLKSLIDQVHAMNQTLEKMVEEEKEVLQAAEEEALRIISESVERSQKYYRDFSKTLEKNSASTLEAMKETFSLQKEAILKEVQPLSDSLKNLLLDKFSGPSSEEKHL